MKKREKKKAGKPFRFFTRFLWIIALIITIFFGYELHKLNVLPTKYFLIVVGVMFLLMFIFGAIALRKKIGRKALTIVSFLLVIYIAIFAFGSLKIKDTVSFMEKNLGIKFETNVYYVLVNKDSEYKKIKDIKGETVYSFKEQENMKDIESALLKKVDVDIEYESSIYDLLNNLTSDNELVVYVNSGNYDVMNQNNDEYSKKVKILETIEIKTKKKVKKTTLDVTEDPFIVLINGIDTRSDSLPSRSLSDVNMLMAINQKTHKILLVSIPRDYYLTIPNTGGGKDKLTHTGTIGGVETTIATIEENFGIKISYYVRVNFNFVKNLVDSIGGIDIYNDQDYGFSCWTDRGCYFEPEWNYGVDGRCALAFARERYAYSSGDRHRGENQQHVIDQILHKVTSSSALVSNYSGILDSLSGTFETNISNEDLSALIKMQINKMPGWDLEKYQVTGDGTSAYTYSYPNEQLYVMIPDESTMFEATNRIKAILGTESDE